jgi:hypothetical protein
MDSAIDALSAQELITLVEALRAGRLSLPASEVALQRYCTAATARAIAT